MNETLKKRYENRKIDLIREKANIVDKQLILEQNTAKLIVEAMDEEDLKKVSSLIDKLRSIKKPTLPVLSAAIEQAEAELNKYTGGGVLTAAWTKLKDLVGIDNPIVKITTFANALERGFSQMPTIIKNNVGSTDEIDTSKSIQSLLAPTIKKTGTAKPIETEKIFTDDPVGSHWPGPAAQNEADNDATMNQRLKNVVQQMLKALSPGGIFGVFKKVPYVDTKALVGELLKVPINELAPLIKQVQAGTKAADVAPDLKDTIAGQGEDETKATEKGDPPKSTNQTDPSRASGSASATTPASKGVGEKPQSPRGGSGQKADPAEKAFKMLKDTGILQNKLKSHVSDEDMKAILSSLKDKGMLK